MSLPQAIKDSLPPDDNFRIGIVLTRFPTTVDIQGNPTPVSALASYTPVVGDNVLLMRQDSTWAIVGRTTTPDTGDSPHVQAGSVDMTVAVNTSATAAVTFATPFRAAPSVCTNINNGSGAVASWNSRAFNITTTGFTMSIFGPSSSFTVGVQWQAQELTQ